MTTSRQSGPVLPIVVTLAALLGGYAAAYYGAVSPARYKGVGVDAGREVWFTEIRPQYAIPHSGRVFAPMHWIDRHLRPVYWTEAGFVARLSKP